MASRPRSSAARTGSVNCCRASHLWQRERTKAPFSRGLSCKTNTTWGRPRSALANVPEPRPWLLHLKISFAGGAEERANRVDPERCSAKRVTGAGVRA